jgi:hypothetical protein
LEKIFVKNYSLSTNDFGTDTTRSTRAKASMSNMIRHPLLQFLLAWHPEGNFNNRSCVYPNHSLSPKDLATQNFIHVRNNKMANKVVIPFLELMVELTTSFLISFQDVSTTFPIFHRTRDM